MYIFVGFGILKWDFLTFMKRHKVQVCKRGRKGKEKSFFSFHYGESEVLLDEEKRRGAMVVIPAWLLLLLVMFQKDFEHSFFFLRAGEKICCTEMVTIRLIPKVYRQNSLPNFLIVALSSLLCVVWLK